MVREDIKGIGQKLVAMFNKLGVQCFRDGAYPQATQLLLKAAHYTSDRFELALFPSDTDRLKLRAATFNNFGCMDRRQGKSQSALKQLRKASPLTASCLDTGPRPLFLDPIPTHPYHPLPRPPAVGG